MQNFNDVSHNERWMTQSVTGSGQRADSKKRNNDWTIFATMTITMGKWTKSLPEACMNS